MLQEVTQYQLKLRGLNSAKFIEVRNPYSNEVIAQVGIANQEFLDKAITCAQQAFSAVMNKMPAYKRSEILTGTAKILKEQQEDFARTIVQEGGKPLKEARIEVARATSTFMIAAEEALRLDGEQIPMDRQAGNEAKIALVVREPIGVIGAITPFNFPLNLVAHKVAPALAAGNTIVLKPSPITPISALKLADVLLRAGLPEGVLSVVPCLNENARTLVEDSRLAMLTFTGSAEIGWGLRKLVAPGVKVVLELGGNAGLIVHSDADLKAAAYAACRGGYLNAGQSCISVQRIYIQETVFHEFLRIFVDLVKNLKLGDPLDETTDLGPMISKNAVDRTLLWIDKAVEAGARIVTGGTSKHNNLMEPTVLIDTKPEMLVVCQEIFGPVVSIMKYQNIDEAIVAMNDSVYGLQAGVFTQDLEIAFKAARQIDVGSVIINESPPFRTDHMPYGGRKNSGMGLEGVKYALAEMTQPKLICLNLPFLK